MPSDPLRRFSADELSRAIALAEELEPAAWKALQDYNAGIHPLDLDEHRAIVEKIDRHMRQAGLTKSLVEQAGLLHAMWIEARRRLGLPTRLRHREFSADEVARAIALAEKLEPAAWKALQDHDAGIQILEREERRNNAEKIRPHLRQLRITYSLADQAGLLSAMRVEMRRRLGLPI